MNDRTTEQAAVEQSSRRWPATAGPPPRRSPRGEAVPPNQRSLRPHDGVQSNAKVYQANSSAGLWPGDLQRPHARETSGSPRFERQRSRLIGQGALRGRQDGRPPLTLDHQQARRAVRTNSSGGFLTLSYPGAAATAPDRRSTCPRHGAQTAHVANFRAWRHDTNYLHDDGVNNMHDHNESATNVSP